MAPCVPALAFPSLSVFPDLQCPVGIPAELFSLSWFCSVGRSDQSRALAPRHHEAFGFLCDICQRASGDLVFRPRAVRQKGFGLRRLGPPGTRRQVRLSSVPFASSPWRPFFAFRCALVGSLLIVEMLLPVVVLSILSLVSYSIYGLLMVLFSFLSYLVCYFGTFCKFIAPFLKKINIRLMLRLRVCHISKGSSTVARLNSPPESDPYWSMKNWINISLLCVYRQHDEGQAFWGSVILRILHRCRCCILPVEHRRM